MPGFAQGVRQIIMSAHRFPLPSHSAEERSVRRRMRSARARAAGGNVNATRSCRLIIAIDAEQGVFRRYRRR